MDQKKILSDIHQQLEPLNFRSLLCGYTILIKDLAEYLKLHALGKEADVLFLKAYNGSLDYHRGYWSAKGFGGKVFEPIAKIGWPFGFAWRAVQGTYDLQKLVDAALQDPCADSTPSSDERAPKPSVTDCKYYAYLGWDVLRRLEADIAPIIYDPDNPPTDVVHAAANLLEQKLKQDSYWYSFAVLYCMIYLQYKSSI